MSRKTTNIKKRKVYDNKFQSVIVGKFINYLMIGGKKSIAEKIAYSAIQNVGQHFKTKALDVFEKAVQYTKPLVELRSRRVGGSTYQIPVEVKPERQVFKSLKWIISASRNKKSGKTMTERLTAELIDAHNKTGAAFKKREETHKMAEANKAFAHFKY